MAERACSPFLRWRPEALFFRAELLERVGRTDEARAVYQRVLSEVRGFCFCDGRRNALASEAMTFILAAVVGTVGCCDGHCLSDQWWGG